MIYKTNHPAFIVDCDQRWSCPNCGGDRFSSTFGPWDGERTLAGEVHTYHCRGTEGATSHPGCGYWVRADGVEGGVYKR